MIRLVLMGLIVITSVSPFICARSIAYLAHPGNEDAGSLIPPYSRGGSISGRIVDSQGLPIFRERVFAVSEQYGGARQPGSFGVRTISVLTGAQGNYRIPEVPPGKYIITFAQSA